MTEIYNFKNMIHGEYYLCYEVFENHSKRLFIGRFVGRNPATIDPYLEGVRSDLCEITNDDGCWYVYEDFELCGDTQVLYLLNPDEVLTHFLTEVI